MSKVIVLDTEIYANYFLLMFKDITTGKVLAFERTPDKELDFDKVRPILGKYTTVSFNGINFDLPIIMLALKGASNEELLKCCNDIIVNKLKPWEIERLYSVRVPGLDHIDIMEVAAGRVSLKLYASRLGIVDLENLPIAPGSTLSVDDMERVKTYCEKDLKATELLYNKLLPQISLRRELGKTYGIDLRSKSDAQIAEHVIKNELKKVGVEVGRPTVEGGTTYKYIAPSYIGFHAQELRQLFRGICDADFIVATSGKVLEPQALKVKVKLGESTYQLGLGGLHSTEKGVSYYSTSSHVLLDRDVASYYPALILNNKLYPAHLTDKFLTVYKSLVDKRLTAKRREDKVTADCLKIVINGSFGKFGSPYSALYSPNLLIQTTITGQLSLLMLIEWLEMEHIPVVSANTDGIVINCPRKKQERLEEIIHEWELETGLETEETEYESYHARDVNNYVAIKPNGYKTKGIYSPSGLVKNPTADICAEAVIDYLLLGIDIQTRIRLDPDIRKFLMARTVNGGAIAEGTDVGKVVRWYYSSEAKGKIIKYKSNGYKVPKSEGAKALMTLPATKPNDIDYDVYIQESLEMLRLLGVE